MAVRSAISPCSGGSVAKLYPTLVIPRAVAHQPPLSMGLSRQEYWSGLPFPSPGDLSHPGIELRSPASQAGSLLSEPPGKPHKYPCVKVAQLCPTLCDPTNCSLQGSSIHGVFQARVLEWVAISFSRGSFPPRDRTQVSCTVGRCFTILAREMVKYRFPSPTSSQRFWCLSLGRVLGSAC